MSNFELPSIDEHAVVLHFAGDDERRLLAVKDALTRCAENGGVEDVVRTRTAMNARGAQLQTRRSPTPTTTS